MADPVGNAPVHRAGWAGIVLAGGASTRMGADKALLEYEGKTLLDRAIAQLREIGADPVVVSGDRPGHDAVPDARPGLGPLGGLHSVLVARADLAARWLMIIPVDMPRTKSATLARLADMAERTKSGAVFDSGPLPMALAPGPARLEAAEDIMAGDGKRAMGALAAALDLAVIPALADDRLDNVNYPEDLDERAS